jgi:peptidoglycan/LPS O-acetylase OafA/YrhL
VYSQQLIGIQALRFVAAMLVVLMHTAQAISLRTPGAGTGHYWTGGSAGVDIFFVISGFVMTVSTRPSPAGSGARRSAAWVFLKRRFVRIAPLYWFYTLLKALVLLTMPSLALRSSLDGGHLAASMLFIPAISPWGWLQPTLPVGWTLNFEMLFYLVFAAAIAGGWSRIGFCLLVFLLMWAGAHFFPQAVPLAFYGHTLLFEFIVGMLVAYICLNLPRIGPPAGLLAVAAGVAFIVGMGWGFLADRLSTWGVGAALLVLGTVWLEPWTARLRMAPRLAFLGDASYSIYLSHTFVVPAGVMALRELGMQNTLGIVALVVVAVVALGCPLHVWLERPLTSLCKRALFKTPRLSF